MSRSAIYANLRHRRAARRASVPDSTIRYYERIGLMPPSARLNGKRRYDATAVDQLGMIRLAQQAGFSIAEIERLLRDFPADAPPSERWRDLSTVKLAEIAERIEQLQRMQTLLRRTLDCACATFDQCVAEMGK